ncbi:MAG: hypothetical protein KatS3mg129_2974 [Leptospiraceae bacterium]|nr:MAG: hypothetical protein KatS3mg129_2974 [Leptospiraceae bacterium]
MILKEQQNQYKELILNSEFFTGVEECEISDSKFANEKINENEYMIRFFLKYAQNTFSQLDHFIVKRNGKWFIDFHKTYTHEMENNPNPFTGRQYK